MELGAQVSFRCLLEGLLAGTLGKMVSAKAVLGTSPGCWRSVEGSEGGSINGVGVSRLDSGIALENDGTLVDVVVNAERIVGGGDVCTEIDGCVLGVIDGEKI